MLNTIDEGIKAVRQGKIVIVVDDENRENEGDFIVSGEKITPDIVNFMITHGRGLLCVPLPRSRCEELQLYPMSEDNTSLLGTPFTMSVDLKGYGCTTGVSAYDRSATIRALVTGNIKPSELARPGHIFPLYGHENGVLGRDGHTEALLDLTRMAGLMILIPSCPPMAMAPFLIRQAERWLNWRLCKPSSELKLIIVMSHLP